MQYSYEGTDQTGVKVSGVVDATTFIDAQRLVISRGVTPHSLAPSVTAVATPVPSEKTVYGSLASMQSAGSQISVPSGAQIQRSGVFNRAELAPLAPIPVYALPVTPVVRAAPKPVVSDLHGVNIAELALFFQLLAPLVKSGMTIHESLDNVAGRTKNANLSKVAHEMANAARSGNRISGVMERYPRIFPDNIVGTVRAGELGGFLEVVLAEVALNFEQNIALYKGSWMWKAMVIQALITLAVAIPLFTSLFNSMDFAANIRLYITREMVLLPIVALICLATIPATKFLMLPANKRWRDTMSLRIPVVANLQRQAAISAFVRMLRRLYQAGVGPINAWDAAMYTADNVVIREQLQQAYPLVQRGASLPDAFKATGLFSDNIEQILITGDLSGSMVDALDQAATVYQDRVQEAHVRSRQFMFRAARLTMIVLTGIALVWFMHSYFAGIFRFVDTNFSE